MQIQIIKCDDRLAWYATKVGETMEAKLETKYNHYVVVMKEETGKVWYTVPISDAVVIGEDPISTALPPPPKNVSTNSTPHEINAFIASQAHPDWEIVCTRKDELRRQVWEWRPQVGGELAPWRPLPRYSESVNEALLLMEKADWELKKSGRIFHFFAKLDGDSISGKGETAAIAVCFALINSLPKISA